MFANKESFKITVWTSSCNIYIKDQKIKHKYKMTQFDILKIKLFNGNTPIWKKQNKTKLVCR